MRLRVNKKLAKNKNPNLKLSSKYKSKKRPIKARIKPRTSNPRTLKLRTSKLPFKLKQLQNQAAASHTAGYQTGYQDALQQSLQLRETEERQPFDDGFNNGFDEGYKKGFYEGGDGLADLCLPGMAILPEVSINQIIEAGVHSLHHLIYNLKGAPEISEKIHAALESKSPLSIVRLGDGELLTLAQETVMSVDQVRIEGKFLSYAGVNVPDLASRDLLLNAIKKADIVGIPKLRLPNFLPLAFRVFNAFGLDYRNLYLTHSTINYELYLGGFFPKILSGRRILLVGNCAPDLSQYLMNHGMNAVGAVAPVKGMSDIPRVIAEAASCEFDIALVAAGIPAVIIAERIASELGKVAIDFGHLADSMVKGEAPL